MAQAASPASVAAIARLLEGKQRRTSVDSWKGCTAVTLLRAVARVSRGAPAGAGFALNTNGTSGAACAGPCRVRQGTSGITCANWHLHSGSRVDFSGVW